MGFALRLPAVVDVSLGLALAVVVAYLVLRGRDPKTVVSGDSDAHARLSVILIIAVAVALSVFTTFLNRPDADDITFFPRAAAQMADLWSPVLTTDTTSDVAGLPGPAAGYLLTSWELLFAFAARVVGADGLSAYQNGGAAVGAALVPMVYYLLFRKLGLRPLIAVAAVAGVVAFLLVDGNDHRSMGNLAFVRLWQGKSVLLTILPAYLLLHTLDFVWRGDRRAWLCVVCAGVAATGLSTIGCFFAPAAVAVTTLAVGSGVLLTRQVDWQLVVKRSLKLTLAAAYPLVIIALTVVSPFPGVFSPLEWTTVATNDPTIQSHLGSAGLARMSWFHQILLPPSSLFRMAWALILVGTVPLLALRGPWRLAIALFAPLFLLVVANPLAGAALQNAVPDVYWRFFYLLPVPLCAGLLIALLVQAAAVTFRARHGSVKTAAGVVLAITLLVSYVTTVSVTTLSKDNVGFAFKRPTAWKLDPATVQSLGPSLPSLQGKRVLADEAAAVALALIDPSTHVLSQRPSVTLTEFALAGRAAEGRARITAQTVAAGGEAWADDKRVFIDIVRRNADAVVVRTFAVPIVEPLLQATGIPWRRIGGDALYTVYVR